MTTDGWGIDDGWIGTDGTWHATPTPTLEAIGKAMGRDERAEPPGRSVRIVRPGAEQELDHVSELELEDGTTLEPLDRLPPDLPLGIHRLTRLDDGRATTLVVSPGRCHLPDDLRTWGVTMQVPTTRSNGGWGIGDLVDVRTMARWLRREHGAGALALSPLHAPTPISPIQTSPYYPSSRRWRSPLLLRVDEVPGAREHAEVAHLLADARAASARQPSQLDRDAVWHRQRAALQLLWHDRSPTSLDDLSRFRAAHGASLEDWARFCTLAEAHGPRWSRWPSALRHPAGSTVARAADPDRVAFHAWVQLLLDEQVRAAADEGLCLIQDLAVGVDPDGADAWQQQDLLALDMSVGAPPDDFAPDGQQWGLPPYVPWRLRDAGYRPFAELIRASMTRGGGLRVDHVMGLARLFWIPRDGSPADGAYVRHHGRDLLEVLAMESARAEAVVIGEDLGTVEAGFRDDLRSTHVLSTRLVWFEDAPPEKYPREALAMVTTHDLPTIAGVWTGADDAELDALGRPVPEAERDTLRRRLDAVVDLAADVPVDHVIDAVHRRLAHSPSVLALATLEDLCEVRARPNVPGTTTERPNWSVPLPLTVEELLVDPQVGHHLTNLASARADQAVLDGQ